MPPTIDLDLKSGKCGFTREAGDQMGWEGMAEIYLCLSEQAPELSRQSPNLTHWHKVLKDFMQANKLNKFEFAHVLSSFITDVLELYPDERYPHY